MDLHSSHIFSLYSYGFIGYRFPIALFSRKLWLDYPQVLFLEGKVTRGCRKFLNENLRKFSSSPNVVKITKSKKMKLEGHEAQTGEIIFWNITDYTTMELLMINPQPITHSLMELNPS
jgi:hypothetical protein